MLSRALGRSSLGQQRLGARPTTNTVSLGRVFKCRRHEPATLLWQPNCRDVGRHSTARLPWYECGQTTTVALTHHSATSSKKSNFVGRPPVVPLSGSTQMTAGIQSAVGTRTGGDTDGPVDGPGQSRATHCRLRWHRDIDIDLGADRRTFPGRREVSLLPRDGMVRARRPRVRLEGGKHVGIGWKMNQDNARSTWQSLPAWGTMQAARVAQTKAAEQSRERVPLRNGRVHPTWHDGHQNGRSGGDTSSHYVEKRPA